MSKFHSSSLACPLIAKQMVESSRKQQEAKALGTD